MDNIPRILPRNCDVLIHKGSWDILPIFQIIEAKGGVPEAELYEASTWASVMTAVVAGDHADAVLKFIRSHGQTASGSSAKSSTARATPASSNLARSGRSLREDDEWNAQIKRVSCRGEIGAVVEECGGHIICCSLVSHS